MMPSSARALQVAEALCLLITVTAFSATPKASRRWTTLQVQQRGIDRREFSISTIIAGMSLSSPAFAATSSIDGEYWDPYHPQGVLSVKADGGKVSVVAKYDLEASPVSFSGSVDDDGRVILEPGELQATYVDTFGNNCLVFADGKRWIKCPPMAGQYTDPNHPQGSRLLTVFPVGFGSDYLMAKVSGRDDANQQPFKLTGKLDGAAVFPEGNRARNQVSIDFSPKKGPSNLIATFDGSGLVFPDGNKWPKVDVFK